MANKYRARFVFTSIVLLSIPLLELSSSAQDNQEEPTKKSRQQIEFETADADGDGKISTDEMKSYLSDQYVEAWSKKIDADGDGVISEKEFKARRQTIAELVVAEEDDSKRTAAEDRRARFRERMSKKKRLTTVEQMNKSYLRKKPRIGMKLGDLTAFDENGDKFDFEDLRGKHAVIVFGCLT
jgi:hypothetical protein